MSSQISFTCAITKAELFPFKLSLHPARGRSTILFCSLFIKSKNKGLFCLWLSTMNTKFNMNLVLGILGSEQANYTNQCVRWSAIRSIAGHHSFSVSALFIGKWSFHIKQTASNIFVSHYSKHFFMQY